MCLPRKAGLVGVGKADIAWVQHGGQVLHAGTQKWVVHLLLREVDETALHFLEWRIQRQQHRLLVRIVRCHAAVLLLVDDYYRRRCLLRRRVDHRLGRLPSQAWNLEDLHGYLRLYRIRDNMVRVHEDALLLRACLLSS